MSRPNNNRAKKEPVPDVPHLRSVLIRAPSSFESVPAPRSLLSAKPPPSAAVIATQSHKEKNTTGQPCWTLTKSQLVPLPEVYPLERSHVYIDAVNVQEVATNIAECLRKESISSCFDSTKAMVLAETPQHVKLCIRLFLDEDQIVVEVQRRSGCCFLFHQCAKAILRAAKGMQQQRLPTLSIPDCVLKAEAEEEEESQDPTEEAVTLAADLLKKDRYDAHLLGMESLVQLTKATSTSTKAALALVDANVLDTILSLIQSWRMSQDDSQVVADEMEQDYFCMMHRNALTVLANVLNALEQTGQLNQVLAAEQRLIADQLLAILIDEVQNADERPHDACQACKCLKTLLATSDETKMRALELGASKAATSALNQGVCTHLLLEQEARTLQVEMER